MNERALQYIRQYRGIYTREAITQQLIANGIPPEEIEEAWQAVEAGANSTPGLPNYEPPTYAPPSGTSAGSPGGGQYYNLPPQGYGRPFQPRPRLRNNPQFWLTFLGFVIGTPLLGLLLVYLSNRFSSFFAYLIYAVLVGAGVGAIYYKDKNWAVSRGLLYGLITVIVVPVVAIFVFFVIIFGICIFGNYRI
jgi:hypothetical protein